jgi:hypothetical protein
MSTTCPTVISSPSDTAVTSATVSGHSPVEAPTPLVTIDSPRQMITNVL